MGLLRLIVAFIVCYFYSSEVGGKEKEDKDEEVSKQMVSFWERMCW